MIEIKLLDDKNAAAAIISTETESNSDMLVYEAVEGEKTSCRCIFSITGEQGRIYSVSPSSGGLSSLADGLLRSALSLMYKRGASVAFCGDVLDKALLLNIGFRQTEGQWQFVLNESFFAGCACDK